MTTISEPAASQFRVEKDRTDAIITLSTGTTVRGCFFLAKASAHSEGPERVKELLNGAFDFFPFEVRGASGAHTVLYNRRHVVVVALTNNEASRDPGYEVVQPRQVAVVLSDGTRITGAVRVYRPAGQDRVSDWARHPDLFRYIETGKSTVLVNVAHVIEVNEIPSYL